MDVSITIANWNRADLLEHCLRSIYATPPKIQYEVIVVDNASSDNSVGIVREMFPQVRVITNSQNLGFGKGQNQAIDQARGRYVLALNNDANVLPETIPTLVEFMQAHPKAGICTCPGRQQRGSPWATGGGVRYFPSVTREVCAGLLECITPPFALGVNRIIQPLSRWIAGSSSCCSQQEVAWAKGALLLIRRSMLDEIGKFDERFFMFFEETDLCLRARRAGWSVWVTPFTSYIHEAGQSTGQRNDKEALYAASGTAYFRKHSGNLRALLFRIQHYLIRQCLLKVRREIGHAVRFHRTRRQRAIPGSREASGNTGGIQ